MKFISLFAGVGGFDLALERLGHECVYANDIDKYCKIIYDKRFTTKLDCRSIRDVREEEIPAHDLLCGGFPCQSFSIAGKRRGFEDTRGTLFYDIARIARYHKPRILFLENVKGLLSHDQGRTFKTIIATLDELGYDCQWQVLNSKNFGVPQNRERVFIVGHLRGTSRPKVFPIGKKSKKDTRRVGQEVSYTIDANYAKGTNTLHKSRRQVVRVPLKFLGRNQKKIGGDYSFTVDTSNTSGIKLGSKIRRLTPIECERLQGFPDNWTKGVSDTQRYKMMGNAVTVNVVYEIAKHFTNSKS